MIHTLVIGPNSDEEIIAAKGPIILTGPERMDIIQSVKWGDETVADTPYTPTEALLDELNC